ncbi:MAG: hypothetical protein WD942_11600 [Dehalococcoidia bacterium]
MKFFSRIGVDHLIAVYGQGRGLGLRAWLGMLAGGARSWGFDYSLTDLKRLGVEDIVLVVGEWNWREHQEEYAGRVRRVSLDDDYEFQLNRFGAGVQEQH